MPGYDGGAFFSHDSKKLVWRASRPNDEELPIYKDLLSKGLVEPKAMNLYTSDIDGNNVELGRKILNDANHPLVQQLETMDGAAAKAAELAAK